MIESECDHLKQLLVAVLDEYSHEIFSELENYLVNKWTINQLCIDGRKSRCDYPGKGDIEYLRGQNTFIEAEVEHLRGEYGLEFPTFTKTIPRYEDMAPHVREMYQELYGDPYLCSKCSKRIFPTGVWKPGQNIQCNKNGWVFNTTRCDDYQNIRND